MKKLALALYLFLMSVNVCVSSENGMMIKAINYEGINRSNINAVKYVVKSKARRIYNEQTVKDDIQRIMSFDFIENAEASFNDTTGTLIFKLYKKPRIGYIDIIGNDVLHKGEIIDVLKLKKKGYFDAKKLEDSKSLLIAKYAEEGYNDCKVEANISAGKKAGYASVHIKINEGRQVLVKTLIFEGLNAISYRKALKAVKIREGKPFNHSQFMKSMQDITELYKNNGYAMINISEPVITYHEKNGKTFADITISIKEGIKYKFGKITYTGNTIFNEAELSSAVPLKYGQIYEGNLLDKCVEGLKELYKTKGYIRSEITTHHKQDDENALMNIGFNIMENNSVTFGKAIVRGNIITKDNVFLREVDLREGGVFDGGKVNRIKERIMNLGFINSVDTEFLPTENPDIMDLGLNLSEGKPGITSFGVGYVNYYGLVGSFRIKHMNMFGRGQILDLLYEFGGRVSNYGIQWADPRFRDKPISLGFSVYDLTRSRPYNFDTYVMEEAYTENKRGFSISAGPRIDEYLSTMFTYRYEDIILCDRNNTLPDYYFSYNKTEIRGTASSLKAEITRDTRDNVYEARSGSKKTLSVEYAGGPFGGNIEFLKPTLNLSWYIPSFWKFVLSCSASFGFIENYETGYGMLVYKYFVGGQNTVRGYAYNGISGPDGGNVMAVYNVEYSFPLVSKKDGNAIRGALFFDAGQTWDEINDFNIEIGNGDKQLKAGVGFGIRFATPVFPLRLDWGYGLNSKPGEEQGIFYLTIGNIFQ